MCAPDFIAQTTPHQPQPEPQPAPAAQPDLGPFAEDRQAARRAAFAATMQPYYDNAWSSR